MELEYNFYHTSINSGRNISIATENANVIIIGLHIFAASPWLGTFNMANL